MARLRGFLLFGGLILIVGPMFGLTLRGFGGLTQGQSMLVGGVFMVIGIIMAINSPKPVPVRTQTSTRTATTEYFSRGAAQAEEKQEDTVEL